MSLQSRFNKYHEENPEVYQLFCFYALQYQEKQTRHCSAWLVMNRVRWETSVSVKYRDSDYKINNDFIALYARKFMEEYPELKDFFRIREMKRME